LSADLRFPIQTSELTDLQHGLDRIVGDKLRGALGSSQPLIVHMLGIPGAGKTVFAQPLFECLNRRLADTLTYVGFDQLMSDIPLYKSSRDPVSAFTAFELPARAAGYALLKGLLDKRASILFDHGGASPDHVEILRYAINRLGYSAFMVHVKCSADEATKRINRRAEIEGRHTPAHYVEDRQNIIDDLTPRYLKLLHGFAMLDNSEERAVDRDQLVANLAEVILCCTVDATRQNEKLRQR